MTILNNDRKRSIILTLLVFAFLSHGVLYFVSGSTNDYYSYDNPIKVIKYAVFFLSLITIPIYQDCFSRKDLLPIGISFFMCVCAFIANPKFNDYIVLLNYCIPVFTMFLCETLERKVNLTSVIRVVYIFASIIGYIEFLFLKGKFGRFADLGYRACSIFVNPNNFSAFLFLSAAILITNTSDSIWQFVCIFNSFVLLRMSGSRSGLLIMAIALLLIFGYRFLNIVKKQDNEIAVSFKTVLVVVLGLFVVGFLVAFPEIVFSGINSLIKGGRSIGQIDLSLGRIGQIRQFFDSASFDFFLPYVFKEVYTDNIMLHVWGFFGFPGFLLYFVGTFTCIIKLWGIDRRKCLLLILLFLFGFFENYLYLWPIAYIYWYCVGTVVYNHTNYSDATMS